MKQLQVTLFFLIGLLLMGCKKQKEDLLLGKPIEPNISGTWIGDVTFNGTSTQTKFVLNQDNINVKGSFEGIDGTLTKEGNIDGVTTGPTFTLKVLPTDAPCKEFTVQAGGQNSGTALSFSITGTDCHGETIRGQATLQKI